ncbi:MAG: hypothetical protein OCD02_13675, partial [Spirochaetaceae bacterium]
MSDDSKKTEPEVVTVVQKELDLTVEKTIESGDDTPKKVVVPRKRVRRKAVVKSASKADSKDIKEVKKTKKKEIVKKDVIEIKEVSEVKPV